ncbi:MAG: M48 family metallopeptidase [Maricaulaceae bacterium]|jgi:predicted Zn-dependent protease
MPQVMMNKRELVKGLASGSVLAFAAGCESVPILVSESQLAAMSNEAWAEMTATEPQVSNPAYAQRLQRVGARITGVSGLGTNGWQYAVFDSEEKNAFVLPGRQVGFYKGIMDLADTDDQLAAVMGHEVGHVRYQHAAQRASQSQLLAGGLAVTGVLLQGSERRDEIMNVLGVGATYGVVLPFSRDNELQADAIGIDYMASAGYQPSQAIAFWRKMSAGGSRPPEFASTHPDPGRRIERIQQQIQANGYA